MQKEPNINIISEKIKTGRKLDYIAIDRSSRLGYTAALFNRGDIFTHETYEVIEDNVKTDIELYERFAFL